MFLEGRKCNPPYWATGDWSRGQQRFTEFCWYRQTLDCYKQTTTKAGTNRMRRFDEECSTCAIKL